MIIIRKVAREEKDDNENDSSKEISNYEKNIDKEKRDIYIKAQNAIKNAKIDKYIKDREIIAKERINFWGALTGKNSLQLQRIENIKLKIELLQTQKIEEKNEYEIKDILADLYSCAITELNGKFTDEMRKIYDEIKEKYVDEVCSEEDIYKLMLTRINTDESYLPVIHQDSKGIFGDIKVQINFLKIENFKLKKQIIVERGRSQFQTFNNKIIPLQKVIVG